MTELKQIEELIIELSEYHHGHFNNAISGVRRKIELIRFGEKWLKGRNPNDVVEERFKLIKDHYEKDCFYNPHNFLKEAVETLYLEFQDINSVIKCYYEEDIERKMDKDYIISVGDHLNERSQKLINSYTNYFLYVINDIVDIYEEKGGDIHKFGDKIRSGLDESTFDDPLYKMLLFVSQNKEFNVFIPNEEYLSRVKEKYPECLK
ncbi:hypothetical protein ACFL1H_01980 [Nanoarchaeota archaeon]